MIWFDRQIERGWPERATLLGNLISYGESRGAWDDADGYPEGGLLAFDNLALAHGRRATQRPGELHERVYGHRSVSRAAQRALRDRVLAILETRPADPLLSAVNVA